MTYSVVVPCYNEEKNLDRLIERFEPIQAKMEAAGRELELVLVENGSKDNSHEKIAAIARSHPYVREVRVPVNQGYGYGILQGLKACTGEFMFWVHADLQLPPEAILDMVDILDKSEAPERVFLKGSRQNRPLSDRFFTWGKDVFESVYLGVPLRDISAPPTGFSRAFYESWANPPYDFSIELYAYYFAVKDGYQIMRVPVIQSERLEGESSWNKGFASRLDQIRRTLAYSVALKKELKKTVHP